MACLALRHCTMAHLLLLHMQSSSAAMLRACSSSGVYVPYPIEACTLRLVATQIDFFNLVKVTENAPCRAVKVWDVPGGAALCGLCGPGGLEGR